MRGHHLGDMNWICITCIARYFLPENYVSRRSSCVCRLPAIQTSINPSAIGKITVFHCYRISASRSLRPSVRIRWNPLFDYRSVDQPGFRPGPCSKVWKMHIQKLELSHPREAAGNPLPIRTPVPLAGGFQPLETDRHPVGNATRHAGKTSFSLR
jgi:hypothetical protein